VHHQWAEALRVKPRGFGEGDFGEGPYGGGYIWRWAPAGELPEPEDPGRQDAKRKPLYEDLLAGKTALATLRELAGELDDLRPPDE
jgi:hypothetical protein